MNRIKQILLFLFIIISFASFSQEVTITQQVLAENALNSFMQNIVKYAKGDSKSRIILEDLMETKSNLVCNDLSNGEMIAFNEYLNLILQQKPIFSFSELPSKDKWQVAVREDGWEGIVIKLTKKVNNSDNTSYFIINPTDNKIVNIYKTLPVFLTYSKLTDVPQPKTKITEDSIVKYGSIELITEVSGKLYIDDVYQKDIVKDMKYTMPEIILGIHSLKIEGENETWQESVTVKDGIKTSIIAKALKKDNGNETVTDYDGNVYKTVTIGTQVWMAENLKTTHYNDGSAIPNVTDKDAWANLTTGAYCNYDNSASNANTYGRLYNWYAVNTGKLAPKGWHVPTDAEWKTLEMWLGMSQTDADNEDWRGTNESGKLKEKGTTHWNTPNTGATNISGFTALPGGYCNYNGTFVYIGYVGLWWSSTEHFAASAWKRFMNFDHSNVRRNGEFKTFGFSVRCVRD